MKIDNMIINNPDRKFIEDLDSLPFPSREHLENEKYLEPSQQKPFTLIKTSRGCPYECIYCTSRVYYGKKWRYRSPEKIVDEIEEVVNKFNINDFMFSSDTFNLQETHVLKICELIKERKLNIRWMSNSRVTTLTEKMAEEMKDSGCWLISLGTESGSNAILKDAKKDQTIEQSISAVNVANKAGLKTVCYFMFGLPGETKESMRNTLDFAISLNPTYAHFWTATPFPGTEFYRIAAKNDWITSYDWRRYQHGFSDVVSYGDRLSGKDIKKFVKYAYRKFYYRPLRIFKELNSIRNFSDLTGRSKMAFYMLKDWVLTH